MKKLLFLIFLFALVLRVFKLGTYPEGFHVDEVKVAWNSLSIAQTLKDDKLNTLPLYYNTFGDYRPTGIFYITAPFVILFGNSIFAVRFASALFGALTVFPLYYLAAHFFPKRKQIGIYAAIFLSVLPWHVSVSRATSEVAISLFFVLYSVYFFLKLIEENEMKYLTLSFLSGVSSYLLYHSARVLLPIYLVILAALYVKRLNLKSLALLFFLGVAALFIILSPESRQRLGQVSITKSEDVVYELERSGEIKPVVYSRNIVEEYGKYFSPDFLIGESAKPYRYLTLGVGLLNYIDVFLFVAGMYFLLSKSYPIAILLLLAASPLTAIVTAEASPNLHRAFYLIPFITILEGIAFNHIKYKKVIFAILGVSLIYFLYAYFFQSAVRIPYQREEFIESPAYRNLGNVELAEKIENYKDDYDAIYITNFPDNLYPWYAFFNDKNPKEFNRDSFIQESNERRYKNIIFTDTKCPSDYAFDQGGENILVIDTWECPVEAKIKDGLPAEIIETINRPDESLVYYLMQKK